MNIFRSAAIKLTVWYLCIILALSVGTSIALYNVSSTDLQHNVQRQLPVSVHELLSPDDIRSLADLRDRQLSLDLKHLKERLVVFNLLVLLFGGVASYALARRTLEPIEESLEAQKRFTSDASHELRTPLTAMQTEIEVALRNNALTKSEAIEIIKSNLEEVGRLKALSEGLLRLARNEGKQSNKIVLTTAIISDALTRIEKIADAKKITVINKPATAKVRGDQASLTELLVILIDNALKYSPSNSKVFVNAKRQGKTVNISVRDEGEGIKSAELPNIFERFYRTDSSRSKKNVEGYGLGLAIAKKIAETHDGHIEVKSAIGKGSTFTIVLPAA